MSKHTPGPWRVNDTHGTRYIETSRNAAIARILTAPSEWKANARLIASAPDLLDALNEMLAVFAKPHNETLWEVVDARAAIAKATGND